MNVWIVNHYAIPPSMGGLVRHYYFSKYLQKKGHSVKIFTSSKIHNTDINMITDKSLYKEEIVDGIEYTFVRSRDYKGNGLDRIINIIDTPFKMVKAMKHFYKQEKPDVIYTSSPDLFVAFFTLLFGKGHKIPVVVEVRDLWPESIVEYNGMSKKNPIIAILYQLEKWIYRKANRLIFTMPGGKDYIQQKGWDKYVDLEKIYHINNGVDLNEFETNRKEFELDLDKLENGEYTVTYAGSIRKANGIDRLVEIAEWLLKHGNRNIHFRIFGDGNDKANLIEYCNKKKIHNVHFYGKVDKKYIPYILSNSNINFMHGVQTGIMKYGCSPNKLFDYIACGRPIISDLNARYDLITEYHLGISVKNPTIENVAKALIKMIEEYDMYSAKAYLNSQNLIKKYDYKELSEKVEEVLTF